MEELEVKKSGLEVVDDMAYISYKPHLESKPNYIIAMGERSNGKTYGALTEILKLHARSNCRDCGIYLRRWDKDLEPERARTLFDSHVDNGVIKDLFGDLYDNITYWAGAWYLARWDDENNKNIKAERPFCRYYSLNNAEHYKSTNESRVKIILFDEFLSQRAYLPDEFIIFMNFISTVVRRRGDVTIFMVANTCVRSSLYFREMGLTKIIRKMQQGTILTVETQPKDGRAQTRVSIEYCADANIASRKANPSDKYFGFDNPRINMITNGAWEIACYPHKPFDFEDRNIRYRFFILWEEEIIRGEVIAAKDPESGVFCDFLYFRYEDYYETDNLPNNALVYSTEYDPRPNYKRKITRPTNELEAVIANYFRKEKVFYEDNQTGDDVLNYVKWCGSTSGIL